MSFYSLSNALTIGAILSLVAVGLYIAFRIVRFPDLSCDGSYAMGACVSAVIASYGLSPWIGIFASTLIGFIAGMVTGGMYTKLKFPPVVAGIITMTAAYSMNLLMMGLPNLAIKLNHSLFGNIEIWIREAGDGLVIYNGVYPIICLSGIGIIFILIWRFLISEIGLCWRCVGIDSNLASSQGINVEISIPLALGLANSLISLAGGLLAHYQRFADVNMGIGIIMVGLASVFIGQSFEVFFKKRHHYCKIGAQVFCVLIGSILYRIIITMAYELGLPTSVFNLVTASLVFLALLSPAMRKNWTTVFSRK